MEAKEDHHSDFSISDFMKDDYEIASTNNKDNSLEQEEDLYIMKFETHQVLDQTQAFKYLKNLVNQLMENSFASESTAIRHLKESCWDLEKAKEKLLEEDLKEDFHPDSQESFEDYDCLICSVSVSRLDKNIRSFGCDHYCCEDCFEKYMSNAINEENPFKTCPKEGCQEIFTPTLIEDYFGEDHTMTEKYREHLLSDLAGRSSNFLKCTLPLCPMYLQLFNLKKGDQKLVNIRCSCGFSHCFACQFIDHRPLECDQMAKWWTKVTEEDKDAGCQDLLKPCPKCLVNVKKPSVSMRPICKNCKHKFCWTCLESVQEHSSRKCHSFNSSQTSSIETFCIKKFGQHLTASQSAMVKKMCALGNFGIFNDESFFKHNNIFLTEAIDLIIDARRALTMSYAALYYQRSAGQETEMYELQQSLLGAALDHLDIFTDPLQVMPRLHYIICVPDPHSSELDLKSINDLKARLKPKVEAVKIAYEKLLKFESSKNKDSSISDLEDEFKKYDVHEDWDWYCEMYPCKLSHVTTQGCITHRTYLSPPFE